jgi:hypothetical protein
MVIYPNIINGSNATVLDRTQFMLYGYDVPVDGAAVIIHNAFFEYEMLIITISLLTIASIMLFNLSVRIVSDRRRKI